MPIPGGIEIATLMANTVIGGILKLMANRADREAEKDARIMELKAQSAGFHNQARDAAGPDKSTGFHWTRRTIALIAFIFIIVWPNVVPVFWPDTPVAVSYSQFYPESIFRPGREIWHWTVSEGVAVTPMQNMVIMAILGLFFGSEIVKRR